jgi:hypothetical protein
MTRAAPVGSGGTGRLSNTKKLSGKSRKSTPVIFAKRDQSRSVKIPGGGDAK